MKRLASLVAFGLAVSLPVWGFLLDRDGPSGPVLGADAVVRALESVVPEQVPGTDELRFYVARRVERGGSDRLAEQRILAARQARFQGYGRGEDLDEAERLAVSFVDARPRDPAAWSSRAQIHLARHEFQDALRAAQRAVALAPPVDGSTYRLRLFDVALAVGEYDRARRILSQEHHREAFQYLVRAARLADRQGDVETARDHMRRALELAEAYAQPRLVLAWNHVELGHFEHHSGDSEAAVGHYLSALDLAPGYPAALEGLGWIAYGVDQDADAARALFEAALENGGHDDLRFTLADVARFQGDHSRAEAWIDSAIERIRQDVRALRLMARPMAIALAERGMLDEALELSAGDVAEREAATSWAVHGWILHRLGRTDVSRAAFSRALSWGTPEPDVYYLAGRAAAERGDLDDGRKLLQVALDAEAELGPVAAGEVRALLARPVS